MRIEKKISNKKIILTSDSFEIDLTQYKIVIIRPFLQTTPSNLPPQPHPYNYNYDFTKRITQIFISVHILSYIDNSLRNSFL